MSETYSTLEGNKMHTKFCVGTPENNTSFRTRKRLRVNIYINESEIYVIKVWSEFNWLETVDKKLLDQLRLHQYLQDDLGFIAIQ